MSHRVVLATRNQHKVAGSGDPGVVSLDVDLVGTEVSPSYPMWPRRAARSPQTPS